MKNSLLTNIKFCILPATAAIMIYVSPILDDSTPPPVKSLPVRQLQSLHGYSWEKYPFSQNFCYDIGHAIEQQHFIIIQNFARRLIENMKDLDPIIAEKFNENFWNLI